MGTVVFEWQTPESVDDQQFRFRAVRHALGELALSHRRAAMLGATATVSNPVSTPVIN